MLMAAHWQSCATNERKPALQRALARQPHPRAGRNLHLAKGLPRGGQALGIEVFPEAGARTDDVVEKGRPLHKGAPAMLDPELAFSHKGCQRPPQRVPPGIIEHAQFWFGRQAGIGRKQAGGDLLADPIPRCLSGIASTAHAAHKSAPPLLRPLGARLCLSARCPITWHYSPVSGRKHVVGSSTKPNRIFSPPY